MKKKYHRKKFFQAKSLTYQQKKRNKNVISVSVLSSIARIENPMVKYHDAVIFSRKTKTDISAVARIETVLLIAKTITAGARPTRNNCSP